jgi:hypothetical protein
MTQFIRKILIKMKDYQIQITETFQKILTIKANEAIEAKMIAESLYKEGRIVLDNNDYIETRIYPLVDFCTTNQLIERIKTISPQILECNLQINGLNATHYICIKEDNKVFDEGIDSKVTKWDIKSYFENYASCTWIIDYVE